MADTSCLFSIVMPVYNAANTLKISIGSIKKQSYSNWELIAVDDGSSDASYEMLMEFAKNDCRVKVIKQENAGPGMARNTGMKACRGDYIAFLDSDDYWDEDFLKMVLEVSENGEKDLVFTDTVREKDDGVFLSNSHIYDSRTCSKMELINRQMTGLIPWGMVKVFKRELLSQVSCKFTGVHVGEEAIFSFELLKAAEKIAFVEKPIYHYVQSATGQHTKGDIDPWRPMILSMKEHLLSTNEFTSYEETLNSLAVKGFCICVYRISCKYAIAEAIKVMKTMEKEYREQFNFGEINTSVLDKSSLMILQILNLKGYLLLYIASRMRKSKRNI